MKYYIFNHQVDTDEVGHVEGHLNGIGKKEYDEDSPNSWYKVPRSYDYRFPPDNLDLDYLSVDRKAKMTDVLSLFNNACGFVLSDKFKQILDRMNLPPHRYYPAIIEHKKKFYHNYFYLHIVWDYFQFLKFDESVFEIWENYGFKYTPKKFLGVVKIDSEEEYYKILVEYQEIHPMNNIISKSLVFKKDFNYDLFPLIFFHCSERLYEAIKSEGITGLDIQPIDFEIRVE
jgi:hypothetical protein